MCGASESMDRRADLVVMGAGPAGCISALLAAREGLRVCLISGGRDCASGMAPRLEGLSPRLRQWLQGQNILPRADWLLGPLPRRVDWSGITSSENSEFIIERPALDAHLCAVARSAGARIIMANARPGADGVELEDGTRLEARWVVDARGRAARRSRPDVEAGQRAPATLSICGWAQVESGQDVAAGLDITAIASGWVWRASLPDGRIWLQYSGDAGEDGSLEARLLRAFRESAPHLRGHRLAGAPIAREAAPTRPASVENLHMLPVGDAFAAMDPLAGHGQFWAVSSALAATAVRHTLTARPGPESERLCRQYLAMRAVDVSLRNARIGRDFMRLETRFQDSPFWAARRAFPDDLPAHEQLDAITVDSMPVVRNGMLEEMDILRTPRTPTGIAWFGQIPAVEAWRAFRAGENAQALAARWGAAAARLPQIFAHETRSA